MAPSYAAMFECDNSAVELLLRNIVVEAVAHGGFVAPGVVIREQNGQLSVHRDPSGQANTEPSDIVGISQATLAPVTHGIWHMEGDRLSVEPLDSASALTARMLQLHADLFTACGKPLWYRTQHPMGALSEDHPALPLLQQIRPQFVISPGAYGFLTTRTLAFPNDRGEREPVLLPIVDSFNHHRRGGRFLSNSGQLRVRERHPTGTTECLANYGGLRDTMDLVLGHGYIDHTVGFAHSAPLVLEIPKVGVLEIRRDWGKQGLRWTPPTIARTSQGAQLSHLTFNPKHVERVVVPVRMLLESLGVADADAVSREMVLEAVARNEELLATLQTLLPGETPVEAVLLAGADYQMSVLQRFREELTNSQ